MSPLALTEVHHVASARVGRKVADAILGKLADRIAATRIMLGEIGAAQLHSALEVRTAYHDLNLDIVDATCVVLADHFDTDLILTLDRRDFRVIRPLRRYAAFQILPDDFVGG